METSSIDEKSYETLSSPSLYLFGLATHENEEGETVWTPLLKYIILGLICVLSFSIRLFAIVRYESVRFFIIIFKKLGKKCNKILNRSFMNLILISIIERRNI